MRPSPASRAAAAASAAAAAVAAAHEQVDGFDEAQISQLIAHNTGHPGVRENGAGPSTAASAEAAAVAAASATAALTHYQVPQSFDATASHEHADGDSFGMEHGAYAGLDQLKEAALADADAGGPGKPQVGTEEWHRVRRNNHKEGSSCPSAAGIVADVEQWSAAVARRSTKESARSLR
jgi:hypothetical protein